MSETPVKWTAAGLTPAGNALQAALLGTGDGLTFTRAAAADAEGVERLDLTLQAPCTVDGPKCRVPVLLTNAGVETGFTMTELRFYVRRVTDGAPTGEEVLYATVTDETGDPIPTAAQSPGFTIDWAFVFQFGNAGSVTVMLDPVGLVSIGMVGQPNGVAGLDDNGAVPIGQGGLGVTTPQAALVALGAGVRPNLLDNAIFSGGGTAGNVPVNQQGKAEYTGQVSTIDRWSMIGTAGRLTLKENGAYFEKTADETSYAGLDEKIPLGNLEGKELTLSCLVDGVCHCDTVGAGWSSDLSKTIQIRTDAKYMTLNVTRVDDTLRIRFYYGGSVSASSTGFLLQAVKLEIGSTQTLAYQDIDGTWKLLPQPESDYVTQLWKCQRYYQIYSSEDERPSKAIDCRPVMRTDPAQGTILVNGVTCYYNTAEL